MQQLEVRSENVAAPPEIRSRSSALTVLDRIVGLLLLASPILFALALFVYTASVEPSLIAALRTTLRWIVPLLLVYQFLIGITTFVQIIFSMHRTWRNTLK